MVEQTYKKTAIQRVGTLGRGCKSRNLIGKRFMSRTHKEFLKVNKKRQTVQLKNGQNVELVITRKGKQNGQ